MENPYYALITLIRAQARAGGDSLFSAQVEVDESGAVTAVLVEEEPVEEDFWLIGGLELTEEDNGATVLCAPFDQGFMILCTLRPV